VFIQYEKNTLNEFANSQTGYKIAIFTTVVLPIHDLFLSFDIWRNTLIDVKLCYREWQNGMETRLSATHIAI